MTKGLWNNPELSVIIPTFNRTSLLLRSIKSILKQVFKNYELIIVDDMSTENIRSALHQFKDRRIQYVRLERRAGAAGARNVGAARAKSRILAFIDSDDTADPRWLDMACAKIESLPETWGVIYPKFEYYDSETKIFFSRSTYSLSGIVYRDLMRGKGLPFGGSGVIVNRAAFFESGGFDQKLHGFHDVDLWYRLSKLWTFHLIDHPLIRIYQHSETRLTSDFPARIKALDLFLNKWADEIVKYAGEDALEKRRKVFFQGLYLSRLRDGNETGSRWGKFGKLVRYSIKNRVELSYCIKNIMIILLGRRIFYKIAKCKERLLAALGR